MYKFRLFKRNVLVNGRYKRSFECLDNGIVHLIDYKNDMVDGVYKIYGGILHIWSGKLTRSDKDFYKKFIEYITFSKNIMKLDRYGMIYLYYINRTLAFSYNYIYGEENVNIINKKQIDIINKDTPKFSNYKDVVYNCEDVVYNN